MYVTVENFVLETPVNFISIKNKDILMHIMKDGITLFILIRFNAWA